jgi:hypothetical protein
VGQDLRREDARSSRDSRDVARLGSEEPLDRVVDERPVLARWRAFDAGIDLGVESGEEIAIEEVFNENGAVAFEGFDKKSNGGFGADPFEAHDH